MDNSINIKTDTDDPVVTDRFLCQEYGIHPTTAWRLRKRKRNPLPHFYVAGHIRYRLSEVRRYFEGK